MNSVARNTFTREELALVGCSDYPPLLELKEPGPVGLYNRCKHAIQRPDSEQWDEMGELGKLSEMTTAIIAARKLGLDETKLRKLRTILHPGGREWQRVSFDPIIEDPPTIFECKMRQSWTMDGWGEPWSGDVPPDIAAQVQGQMEAISADRDRFVGTNLPDVECVYVAVCVNGQRVEIFPVKRDREIGGALREHAERFWVDHVKTGIPPFMDHTGGARYYLDRAFPKKTKVERPALPHEVEAIREFIEIDRRFKALEKQRDTLENELREAVGNDYGIVGAGWKIRFKEMKGRTKSGEVIEALASRFGVTELEIQQMKGAHRGEPYRMIDVRKGGAHDDHAE